MTETEKKLNLSLVGAWKLIKQGSDYIPGIDKIPGSPPIVLKLKGNSATQDELFFIGYIFN